MAENKQEQIRQIEEAIAVQEGLRGVVNDAVIDVTLDALRKLLDELESELDTAQQRKLMSVMFVDVVDSTGLMRMLDPEEGLAIMDAALEELARAVRKLGGKVLRFMGDGFLAAFGLDRARENDPEMAVRAGLAVLENASQLAIKLEEEHHLANFRIRAGVNTGLVVTGGMTEGKATIMGSAVNLAARLESAAPENGLLISHSTYNQVHGLFEVETKGAIQVKGIQDPVVVYRVIRPKPRAFRLETRGVEGVETSMIGREAELRSLQEAFLAVAQGRKGRFITVTGEAGLGKSRLLAEFEIWLEEQNSQVELLKGRAALENQELPFGLLRDVIARRFAIMDDDALHEVRQKLVDGFRKAVGDAPNLERDVHFVGHLIGYDFHDSPHLQGVLGDPRQIYDRALLYLTNYLQDLVQQRVLAVFLDDIHWADGKSLDIFLRLFDELVGQKLLIIAFTRRTIYERLPAWGQGAGHQRLDLNPLSREQSDQLVRAVLQKVGDVPDTLRDLLIENAEGNPFYLEELIKMLLDDGVIVREDPFWRIRSERLVEVRIPPTLTGVLQARIEGLPADERLVLQQASVIGRVFWDEVVCYINAHEDGRKLNSDETRLNLDLLQAREMIFEHANSVFSDAAEFLFKHVILRDVTYESVLISARKVYHGLVADWLIAHSGERAREVEGLIAGHLDKAGKKSEAAQYFKKAGDTAVSNYALDEAVDFYDHGLAITSEEDFESRFSLLNEKERALGLQGSRAAQREQLNILTAAADRGVGDTLADQRKQCQVALKWAWFDYWVGDFEAGREAVQQAIALAEELGIPDFIQQAYYAGAWIYMQLAEHETALSYAEKVEAYANLVEDETIKIDPLPVLSLVYLGIGNYGAARDYAAERSALMDSTADLAQRATAYSNLGVAQTLLGDFGKARENFMTSLEISREIGYSLNESTFLVNLAWVSQAEGKWEEARDFAQQGIQLKREFKHKEAVAEGLLWLGHAWLGLGEIEEARTAYEESMEIRLELEQPNLAMSAAAGLARAAVAQGNRQEAAGYANQIAGYLEHGGSLNGTWEPLRIYLTCYQVLEMEGDDRARKVLEEACRFLEERTARITAERDREMYLRNVPWNREVAALCAAY